MLSRVADSLYWMSRYIERAEDITRILTVNFHALLDLPALDEARAWQPLIKITGDEALFEECFAGKSRSHKSPYNSRNITEFLLWHPANPNAVVTCITHARENARSVREQISSEMWESLNRLYFLVQKVNKAAVLRGPADFFTEVRDGSHIFQGITHATMTHNDAYDFIHLGKHIERGDKTTRILDVKYASLGIAGGEASDENSPQAALQLMAMLKSCSAMEAYRKEHQQLQTWRVAEFLLLNREFPRSVLFCLNQVRKSLDAIAAGTGDATTNDVGLRSNPSPQTAPQRQLGRLVNEMEYLDIRDVLGGNMHPYLDQIQQRLNQAGNDIAATFFSTQIILPGTKNYQQVQQQQ
jgi:uncharacterized alpha-E superfamily protein